MFYIILFFMVVVLQVYMLFIGVSTGDSYISISLLSAISLVSFALYVVSTLAIASIMKIIEIGVSITCKKYLTEERVPDLKMTPVPADLITEKRDSLIETSVNLLREKEGMLKSALMYAARWRSKSFIEELSDFVERQEFENVKEKELVHFLIEWRSKGMAEVFCRLPFLIKSIAGAAIIGACIVSALFTWVF
jgi:hypothetical protein